MMTNWNIMVLLSVYIFNDWYNNKPIQTTEDARDDKPATLCHEFAGLYDVGSPEDDGSSMSDDPVFHFDAFASYTVQNIIVDVLEPLQEMYDVTVDGEGKVEKGRTKYDVFANSIFQNPIWVSGQPVPTESVQPQLRPAYRVANGIWSAIGLMVSGYPFELYGERLFASIGSIEIRVNGIFMDIHDVTSMICGEEGLVLEPDWASTSGEPEKYIDKVLRIVNRRRQHGLWDMKTYRRLREMDEAD